MNKHPPITGKSRIKMMSHEYYGTAKIGSMMLKIMEWAPTT
jgi:hypothetical protein